MKRDERAVHPEDVTERFILEFKFSSCQRRAMKIIYEMRIMTTSGLSFFFSFTYFNSFSSKYSMHKSISI